METLFNDNSPFQFRALTWKEPYASLMLCGKIETRKWNTVYRGEVLICAGKVPYEVGALLEIAGAEQLMRIAHTVPQTNQLRYIGKAFAVATLTHTRPMRTTDEDACFVEYQRGLICHVYENVRPIIPISFKGAQGWTILNKDFYDTLQFV